MAGGFGSRLRPLTEQVPKPMLPIGERPLLERTIEQLARAGVSTISIVTHYKGEMIREHFGDGAAFGVDVRYIHERSAIGTAGSLGALSPSGETLLVVNGDIVSGIDYRSLVGFHRERRADVTVATLPHSVQIPYGVVECCGVRVTGVREKPRFDFLISAGIYVMEPKIVRYVPRDEYLDMPDLLAILVKDGLAVVSFPLLDYWADIGNPSDYLRAQSQHDAR